MCCSQLSYSGTILLINETGLRDLSKWASRMISQLSLEQHENVRARQQRTWEDGQLCICRTTSGPNVSAPLLPPYASWHAYNIAGNSML